MSRITLYHGTSVANADAIMTEGFKDRVGSGRSNWEGDALSIEGFVYLTSAYAFYFAQCAAAGDEKASIIKVEIDVADVYPDEDILRFFGDGSRELEKRKDLGQVSLERLGNVAVKPDRIRIVGRKDFSVGEMWRYSDPSISPLNYKILGGYYRKLVDTFFEGGDWRALEKKISI